MAVFETIDGDEFAVNRPGNFVETRRPLREATHLPSEIYTSEALYELEKEKIYMQDWLAVARVEEIERAGDYMTFNIMGEPIVVTRDRAGTINAFYNICAHRGVEVVTGEGNAKQFKCPYHAWDLRSRRQATRRGLYGRDRRFRSRRLPYDAGQSRCLGGLDIRQFR